jgi:hypothetical protein
MGKMRIPQKTLVVTVLVLVVFFGAVISAPALADRGKKTPPYSEYEDKQINGVELDGRGLLERIEKDVCVISDVLRPFARFVSYYSAQDGTVIYSSKFTPGKFVGYRMNSKREITELWLFGE